MQATISTAICTTILLTLAASTITWYVSLQHQFTQELRKAQLSELAESLASACVELISAARSSTRQELTLRQRLDLPALPQGYACELRVVEQPSVPKSYSISVFVESEGEPHIQVNVSVPIVQKYVSEVLVLNEVYLGDMRVTGRLEGGASQPYIFVKKAGNLLYLGLGVVSSGT